MTTLVALIPIDTIRITSPKVMLRCRMTPNTVGSNVIPMTMEKEKTNFADRWCLPISPQIGSSPRWEKLIIGYHNYPLKGINLRYMYCSKKMFLNKLKYINMISRKCCSYWYVLIVINFGFKVRYMYCKIMFFFWEVMF